MGPEALSFNTNVTLKAMMGEIKARQPEEVRGAITNRHDAMVVTGRAKAEVIEMEEARERREA